MLSAYEILYYTLENAGHATKLNMMENEVSTALKLLLQKIGTVVQLDPPHIHRRNTVERAIHTFKNILCQGRCIMLNGRACKLICSTFDVIMISYIRIS